MAKAGVARYAWLIANTHSIADFSSVAYPLIFNRGFCSDVDASSHSVNFKLGREDRSRTELMAFLKSYDFSQAEIDKIVQSFPCILSYRVSTNLKPKLDYFVECGFSGSAIRSVFTSNPRIFGSSLDSSLKPRYQFLKTYLKDEVIEVIKRQSRLLCSHNAETNIEYLKKQGVPQSSISKLLVLDPRLMGHSKNSLVNCVEATKALGIGPSARKFPRYIRLFGSMNKTCWKKKVEVLKSLGWSDEDVRATLLHYPTTFALSEDNIRRTMGFYINNVNVDPRDVIAQPILLLFSLNERIIPRYEVLKLLRQYHLFESGKISRFFRASEKDFITNYVEENLEQVPHLLQVYRDGRKAKSDTPRLNP